MGLGPPVCIDCKTLSVYNVSLSIWRCPACNKHTDYHLWELSNEEQKVFEDNFKFYQFLNKKANNG